MRSGLIFACFFLCIGTCALVAAQGSPQIQNPPAAQQQNPAKPVPVPTPPPQQSAPGQTGATPQQPVTPQPQTLRVVVIDPAHGGADAGARGANGVAEKDIVLDFAHQLATALQAEGFSVVITRQGDTDPTADDRATIANSQTDSIFISLHVSSTGPMGTVRTYSYLFPSAVSFSPPAATSNGQSLNLQSTPTAAPAGFLSWDEAQKPFVEQSKKLGDLIQSELAPQFKGSPQSSSSVPVFALRSITSPAVAIELSSIAANPQQLEAMAPPLAEGIARAVAAYKTIYPPGGR